MIMPRFTIRTALVGVTLCALVFVVVGMAVRGESWAWGITIGFVSLIITLIVHALWFFQVSRWAWLFSPPPALPTQARTSSPPIGQPSNSADNSSDNRGEAQP